MSIHETVAVDHEVENNEVETATSTDALAIINTNVEYRVYALIDSDGNVKDRQLVSASQSDPDFKKYEERYAESQAKLPAEKQLTAQLEAAQTIAKPKFGSVESFMDYIDDPEEAMNIINRGVASKFNQKINSSLMETSEDGSLAFPFSDGVFDPRELIQESTRRRSMSPAEKAVKALKQAGFKEEDVLKMLAQLQASAE